MSEARLEMTWEAIAYELKAISKALSREYLPEAEWQSYCEQIQKLQEKIQRFCPKEVKESKNERIQELRDRVFNDIKNVEMRLHVLNPEERTQVHFQFFTRQIVHYEERLAELEAVLCSFDDVFLNLSTNHCKRAQIEREMALLRQGLENAERKREALLA